MNDVVQTNLAPKAIGPYSQAIRASQMVFTAGQIGLDPARGELVGGGIEAETRRALDNLKAVLEAAGANFSQVVKTTIFLIDMADFATVNQIYGTYVSDPPPARSTVAVAALPKGARVEIEAVAVLD
ncbi:MAG: RidA family protein [Candidatus Xenobia bacterium]